MVAAVYSNSFSSGIPLTLSVPKASPTGKVVLHVAYNILFALTALLMSSSYYFPHVLISVARAVASCVVSKKKTFVCGEALSGLFVCLQES